MILDVGSTWIMHPSGVHQYRVGDTWAQLRLDIVDKLWKQFGWDRGALLYFGVDTFTYLFHIDHIVSCQKVLEIY